MKRKLWMMTALLLMIPALLLSVSCAKKTVAVETKSATDTQADSSSEQVVGAAVTVTDTDNDGMGSMPMQEDIYFEFDKAALTAAAKESLIRKADWLEKHSTARVIIEYRMLTFLSRNCYGVVGSPPRPHRRGRGDVG